MLAPTLLLLAVVSAQPLSTAPVRRLLKALVPAQEHQFASLEIMQFLTRNHEYFLKMQE